MTEDVAEEVQAEEEKQTEEHKVKGEGLIAKIKELIHDVLESMAHTMPRSAICLTSASDIT